MQQLTLRGFDPEVEVAIKETAEALGTSLNKAALHLIRQGSGLDRHPRSKVIGHRLDHLFGDWSEDEEREFRDAVAGLGQVDEEMWT